MKAWPARDLRQVGAAVVLYHRYAVPQEGAVRVWGDVLRLGFVAEGEEGFGEEVEMVWSSLLTAVVVDF